MISFLCLCLKDKTVATGSEQGLPEGEGSGVGVDSNLMTLKGEHRSVWGGGDGSVLYPDGGHEYMKNVYTYTYIYTRSEIVTHQKKYFCMITLKITCIKYIYCKSTDCLWKILSSCLQGEKQDSQLSSAQLRERGGAEPFPACPSYLLKIVSCLACFASFEWQGTHCIELNFVLSERMEVTVEWRCFPVVGRNLPLLFETRGRPAKSVGIELLDRTIPH